MKHTIEPFTPDKLYQLIVSTSFTIKAQSSEEAKAKIEALLAEIEADHWEFERICQAEN